MLMCYFAYLVVLWCVAGAEEGSEVHGAGCQRICSCSGGGHRQGTHPGHPAAEGALPLPVGNVQGSFRGTPLTLQPLRAYTQKNAWSNNSYDNKNDNDNINDNSSDNSNDNNK